MLFDALLSFPFWKPLAAALLLGCLLPLFGRHMVLGRSVLLGLAVPQITMAGIATAFCASALHWLGPFTFEDESALALLGGLAAGIPALFLTGRLSASSERAEPLLLLAYLGAVSFTHLLLAAGPVGETYLHDLLQGRLLLVSTPTLIGLALILGFGACASLRAGDRILLILTDPEYAQVAGLRVHRWRQTQWLLDGLATGAAVAVAGPTVTFALLILPTLAAAAAAKSLRTHLLLSCALGLLGAVGGLLLSLWTDLPSGDCVTALSCGILATIWLARRIL